MRKAILVFCLLVLLVTGCAKRLSEDWILIADTSISVFKNQKALVDRGVSKVGEDFVRGVRTGSSLKLVGFSPLNTAYKHLVLAQHDFVLEVPADESRRQQAQAIREKFTQAIARAKGVRHTPLLEVIRFESELIPADRTWRLVVISDLIQSTDNLNFTTQYLANRGNSDIVADMLLVCPKPKNPPQSVTLYWYPGLLKQDQAIDPETHARIRRLFNQFFRAWAGEGCKISIEPLQE